MNTSEDVIDARWMTDCLRSAGVLSNDARVARITVTELHQGMTGRVLRVGIDYGTKAAGPRSVIAKLPGGTPQVRDLVRRFRLYEREAGFYRVLAPRAGVPVPRCYLAGPAGALEPVLLLEDLAPATAGDLLAGCDPVRAEEVLLHLARMHAQWWASSDLASLKWLPTARELVPRESAESEFKTAWDLFLDRHGDRLPKSVKALGNRLRQDQTVLDRLSKAPLTLVHGDCRINNVLFYEGGRGLAAIVDWQVAIRGRPASDVACLLVNSLDPALRRQVQHDLVRSYHRALTAHGVTGYSLDRCWLDFRLETLSELIQTIVWASLDVGTNGGTGALPGAAAAARLFASAEDLDLLALVPAVASERPGRSSRVRAMDVNIAGFRIGVTTTPERAARIERSALYRRLVKPGLELLGRRPDGSPPPPPEPQPPSLSDPEAAAIWEKVSRLGWYHTIDLGHGVATPGFIDNRPTVHRFGLPEDMTGMRGLDIGTYDGFWAFEMERRGASEVVGIDLDDPLDHDLPRLAKERLIRESGTAEGVRDTVESQLAQVGMQLPGDGFRLAKQILGSRAERRVLDVYAVSPETVGTFDVVMISQLLLRLRDPQTVIENMFSVTKEFAIIAEPYDPELEELPRPVSEFVGTEKVGAWWGHSIKSLRKMMEVAGFDPIEEVARFPVTNRVGSFSKVILKGHVPPRA